MIHWLFSSSQVLSTVRAIVFAPWCYVTYFVSSCVPMCFIYLITVNILWSLMLVDGHMFII